MKKLLFILPLLFVFSCTVQKRKYQNGFYVQWHSKHSKKEAQQAVSQTNLKEKKVNQVVETPKPTENKEVFASAQNNLSLSEIKKTIKFLINPPPDDSCDVLVFKDGAEIKGKITEKTLNDYKYKRCDTPDGPTYVSKKSDLFMIKYANGTREVIRVDEPPRPTNKTSVNDVRPRPAAGTFRQNHPLSVASLGLGIIGVAALFFIGAFGGYLTLGLFLAAFLISFIAAIAATITGSTALKRIKQQPEIFKGKGFAVTGFIMGMVLIGIWAIILMLTALILSTI